MTLDAVEDKKKSNRLKAVFPNVNYLKDNYTYLQKYPILLPVAWGQRILSYLKKNKTSSYINTMELGKQRIELLKEYKIIKQVINFKLKKYIYKIKNVNVKEKQG